MHTLDCRNLACPAPVIAVKNALKDAAALQVRLDDGAPRENVTRFARNRGYQVAEQQDGNDWLLTITAQGNDIATPLSADDCQAKVLLITTDKLGDGPDELGHLLMRNFIHTLLESAHLPSHLLFMNRGVMLTTDGSQVLEALSKLGGMGAEIYSCGLCLDFFGLKEQLRVGATTNMLSTVEILLSSAQVIKL